MNTYKFVQNNSGGYYVGPAEFVVRAESVDDAWTELKNQDWFTTYFCECCGVRWSDPDIIEPIKESNMNWKDIASVDLTDTELKELRYTVKSLQDTVKDLQASLEIEQMLNRALMKKVQRFENV
jgi:hypothetical protein